MSDKFAEIVKEKMAEIKKQRDQDNGKTAPEIRINREPEAGNKTDKPVQH
tara:strand:- start:1063 stop:1212 length:150 start_codon:yes stop_codon:yes gene_type:complete